MATRFGLDQEGDLEKTILLYMLDKVEQALADHDIPATFDPDELVGAVATCLNLEFIEIYNDEDIQNLPSRLPFECESVVTQLQIELRSKDTFAFTIRRQAYANWERPFLAVIDCRKDYNNCGFFSKWHEIAHLLVDKSQSHHIFRRSAAHRRDPEEILADRIAKTIWEPIDTVWLTAALLELAPEHEKDSLYMEKKEFIRGFLVYMNYHRPAERLAFQRMWLATASTIDRRMIHPGYYVFVNTTMKRDV